MPSEHELWLPKSEMKVTVQDGEVYITETMTMERRKVKKPAGFVEEKKDAVDNPRT